MYNLKLGKKLQPARKRLKALTSKLQAKLHMLKRIKALRNTTKKFNSTLLSLLGHPCRSSPHLRRKRQASTRPLTALCTHRRRQIHLNFAPVYIDDLFTGPVVKAIEPPTWNKTSKKGATSDAATPSEELFDKPMKDLEMSMSKEVEEATPCGSADVLGSPELSEVDERAERFIAEFRKEMSLQRQRSFKEYQEMLQRGVM